MHGQKGVVTILDDSMMPKVGGKSAEIVIGSSSIIKRQTVSQLLEAAYGMYCYNLVQRQWFYDTHPKINNVDEYILSVYEKSVTIHGQMLRRSTTTTSSSNIVASSITANFGMIRVMQSSFLASFRISSTDSTALM